jgi:hypothetical protein
MDDDYVTVSPSALWRRRLLIAALILPFLAVAWGFEVVYDNWRASSGPNAWFIVYTQPTSRAGFGNAKERVLTYDHFASEEECAKEISRLQDNVGLACRRLLLSDATKMLN